MWLRSVVLGCLIVASTHPYDVGAADPASEFEKLVRAGSESTARATPVYLNKTYGQWAKRRFFISNVKYDVKRTDSLLNPIVGIIAFTLQTEQTALLETKDGAERATNFDASHRQTYKISLVYTYKNDRWALKDGEFEIPVLPGNKYPITAERILAEPDAEPLVAVKYWLP